MRVIVDMLLTIAVEAVTAAAIAEFQIWMRNIGLSADGAFMPVGGHVDDLFRPGSSAGGVTILICLGPCFSGLGVCAVAIVKLPLTNTVATG